MSSETDESKDVKSNIVGTLKIPPSSNIRSTTPCQVCFASGATLHYGGMVCGGCKIFFARAVQRKIYYVCEKNGSCRMVTGKRSKCRSCRFQRCLKARMCPEEVGKLRDQKLPERLLLKAKEESCVVPYFDMIALQYSNLDQSYNMGFAFIDQFRFADGAKAVARMFVNLERCCDNDTYAVSVPEKYTCTLDVSIADALRNPLTVCERTPLSWPGMKAVDNSTEMVKLSYCRMVLHYLEWLAAIEDLLMLNEKDRLTLTTSHLCPVVLLTMCFNTFKYNSDGFLLCNGFFYKKTEEENNDQIQKMLNALVDEFQRKVVYKFKELNLLEEEYVLLKLVMLFTTTQLMCDESSEIVRRLRNKYEQLLLQYIKDSRQDLEPDKVANRVADIFDILAHLISLSELPDKFFIRMVSLNLADMRGELSYDIHLRKYT